MASTMAFDRIKVIFVTCLVAISISACTTRRSESVKPEPPLKLVQPVQYVIKGNKKYLVKKVIKRYVFRLIVNGKKKRARVPVYQTTLMPVGPLAALNGFSLLKLNAEMKKFIGEKPFPLICKNRRTGQVCEFPRKSFKKMLLNAREEGKHYSQYIGRETTCETEGLNEKFLCTFQKRPREQ